jgi:hypothetical protein
LEDFLLATMAGRDRAMLCTLEMPQTRATGRVRSPKIAFCKDKFQLLSDLVDAIHELNTLQNEQTQAIINEDPDFGRFDILLHIAQEKKETAKYRWIGHVEAHGCGDWGAGEWH